jgi:hypothetical protein
LARGGVAGGDHQSAPSPRIAKRTVSQLAKTDQIDARLLALWGERIEPPLRELPDEQTRCDYGSGTNS